MTFIYFFIIYNMSMQEQIQQLNNAILRMVAANTKANK